MVWLWTITFEGVFVIWICFDLLCVLVIFGALLVLCDVLLCLLCWVFIVICDFAIFDCVLLVLMFPLRLGIWYLLRLVLCCVFIIF